MWDDERIHYERNRIMKRMALLMSLALMIGVAGMWFVHGRASADSPLLRHVVMLKFKADAKPEAVQKVEQAFRELQKKIPVVQSLEWGTDVSPEKLSQGFTHCFFLTFKTDADRDAYLVHPDHKAFGASLGPVLDKVLVLDYWAKS
jgi:hypothetical protein